MKKKYIPPRVISLADRIGTVVDTDIGAPCSSGSGPVGGGGNCTSGNSPSGNCSTGSGVGPPIGFECLSGGFAPNGCLTGGSQGPE